MTQREYDDARRDLVLYRIETAKEDLDAAKLLLAAYYAIFHSVSAVHALDGKAYKRHKDAIANFNKDYVRAEIFPKEMGRRITGAEAIRHASDYDDFYIASKEETEKQVAVAEEFIKLVEEYCTRRLGNK